MSEAGDAPGCRADLWLWRARLFKTRAAAARACEAGRIRLTRVGGLETRLDKPGRLVRPGDAFVFAHGGRLISVTVADLGWRRGPAPEARALYFATLGGGAPPPLSSRVPLPASLDPHPHRVPHRGGGGPPKAVEGARSARVSPALDTFTDRWNVRGRLREFQ